MKFNFLAILLGFGLLMAVLFGIGLILSQEDTTSSSVCQDTAGYKTFNNSHLSFQYPPNLTVTELDNSYSVQINTANPVDPQNYGIFIQVMDKSEYIKAKDEAEWKYNSLLLPLL